MVRSWWAASRVAMPRQCPSDPPAKSVPKRWMTHASFIGTLAELQDYRIAALQQGSTACSPFVLPVFPFCNPVILQSCNLLELRVFERQLLDAREQEPIHTLLTAKVLEAVLIEPAGNRQEHLALDEDQ